jgi:hypothetical protein
MYAIKFIWVLTLDLVKQAWLLPQTVRLALWQRQQQRTRRQFEVERLDRIRNPSKYAGR